MSRLEIVINGEGEGMLMHAWDAARLLSDAQEEERIRIVAKTASKRSEDESATLRRYDTLRSLYIDAAGRPTVPQAVIRSVLEQGARQQREGNLVRSNVIVETTEFSFDEKQYGSSSDDWGDTLQHNAGVKVGQSQINRSRALFRPPWSVRSVLDIEDLESGAPEVDKGQIERWMKAAGRRIGLGDWRPAKSGTFGRFTVGSCEWLP